MRKCVLCLCASNGTDAGADIWERKRFFSHFSNHTLSWLSENSSISIKIIFITSSSSWKIYFYRCTDMNDPQFDGVLSALFREENHRYLSIIFGSPHLLSRFSPVFFFCISMSFFGHFNSFQSTKMLFR